MDHVHRCLICSLRDGNSSSRHLEFAIAVGSAPVFLAVGRIVHRREVRQIQQSRPGTRDASLHETTSIQISADLRTSQHEVSRREIKFYNEAAKVH
jgi:hypothetical protein